jgi:hypothetical protein
MQMLQALELFDEDDDRAAFLRHAPRELQQHLDMLSEPMHAAALAARLEADGTLDLSCAPLPSSSGLAGASSTASANGTAPVQARSRQANGAARGDEDGRSGGGEVDNDGDEDRTPDNVPLMVRSMLLGDRQRAC